MPLNLRSSRKLSNFNVPVSYRISEERQRLRDALNVYSNQDRLETRHGISRYNATALGGVPLSMSFFKDVDSNRHLITKVGANLLSVKATGAHTTIQGGLNAATTHQGITLNNRHFFALGSDGLAQWDGTTYSQVGQIAPAIVGLATTTGSLDNSTYDVVVSFVSSVTGFESNAGLPSAAVATSSQGLNVTSIPATAPNSTIDKVWVYLRDVSNSGDFLFVKEIDLGTTSTTITANPTSTRVPIVTLLHGAPLAGGAKFLTEYDGRLVYAGNSTFKNDVFFSEVGIPDGFNGNGLTQTVLNISLDGDITGLATGFFNDSQLQPYLVIFKKTSTHLFSEIGGIPRQTIIDDKVGCVSANTIKTRNGNIYFLSTRGWREIINGRMPQEKGKTDTLGGGDILDIFTEDGFVYGLNKSQFANFFSVYYSVLDQYITFCSEGSNSDLRKAYNFQFDINGFTPYRWDDLNFKCGTSGEDTDGEETVFIGADNQYIHTHSINEDRNDVDRDGVASNIDVFAQLVWISGNDMDASYNYRSLIIKAIASINTLDVKYAVNYNLGVLSLVQFTFPDPLDGFVLDVSKLDEGLLTDGRTIVTDPQDLNIAGESLVIGFYQNIASGNINLISAQLDMSKNGNRN